MSLEVLGDDLPFSLGSSSLPGPPPSGGLQVLPPFPAVMGWQASLQRRPPLPLACSRASALSTLDLGGVMGATAAPWA